MSCSLSLDFWVFQRPWTVQSKMLLSGNGSDSLSLKPHSAFLLQWSCRSPASSTYCSTHPQSFLSFCGWNYISAALQWASRFTAVEKKNILCCCLSPWCSASTCLTTEPTLLRVKTLSILVSEMLTRQLIFVVFVFMNILVEAELSLESNHLCYTLLQHDQMEEYYRQLPWCG